MVKLIMGLSGSGKTKTLIDLVRAAIDEEHGDVICIEKSKHLTYDIPYQARLIRTDDYSVKGNTMLYGFLCGLHAGNYDISHFFIDDLNKILDDRSNEALERFLEQLDAFGRRENVSFTITINADPAAVSDGLKKYF
ncbi:MAG: ATP-binding protein [Oscillospiraceae bacterium]|nr:ATP-binding protein [Oscillospiraceae bacterium]